MVITIQLDKVSIRKLSSIKMKLDRSGEDFGMLRVFKV
jgi:hypothetical protein